MGEYIVLLSAPSPKGVDDEFREGIGSHYASREGNATTISE